MSKATGSIDLYELTSRQMEKVYAAMDKHPNVLKFETYGQPGQSGPQPLPKQVKITWSSEAAMSVAYEVAKEILETQNPTP